MSNYKGMLAAFALSATMVFGAGGARAMETDEQQLDRARGNQPNDVIEFLQHDPISNLKMVLQRLGKVANLRLYENIGSVIERLRGRTQNWVGGGRQDKPVSENLQNLCRPLSSGKYSGNLWMDVDYSAQLFQSVDDVTQIRRNYYFLFPGRGELGYGVVSCLYNVITRERDLEGFLTAEGLGGASLRLSWLQLQTWHSKEIRVDDYDLNRLQVVTEIK